MAWTVKIGQGGSIRTQKRVAEITVNEDWAHSDFSVTVQNPTSSERTQAKGRIDASIIQIKRGSEILIEGFIEDVENGENYVRYTGRSFLVMLGYSTNSITASSSPYNTNAEYSDDTGATIISDLIQKFCYYVDGDTGTTRDSELTYSDITFTETYGGDVKLHGRKVYDITRDMCNMYGKDLWSDATWNGDGINIDNKNIHIGTKSRGSSGSPHKTLYGGQHLRNIPVVKYRTQGDMVNCLRVIGKGTGKDRVSKWCQDNTSVAAYGYMEGSPYISNMIADEATAEAVGDAIIADKKDPVEKLHVDLIYYINDLKYGDWVRIVDSHSGVDSTKRIKSIIRSYNFHSGESMKIEVGSMFNNYEKIIQDLTKGDVDNELEMTKLGGVLSLTANDPPDNYVRHEPGMWYDTTGTVQERSKGVCTFWDGTNNPSPGNYKKALIQISNTGSVDEKFGTQYASKTLAQNESISADALNMPLGEVILKGKSGGAGSYIVEDVYSSDSGYSYIYRDVRPIVGSSSSGFGGEGWELTTATKWVAATAYIVGDYIGPNTGGVNRSYECTTVGTSGGTEPTWTTTIGNTNNDNTAVWTCRSVRLVPIEQGSVTDVDIWVKPQGSGIVYLG